MSADISLVSATCCECHGHNITHNVAPMLREAGLDWHDYLAGDLTADFLMGEVLNAYDRLVGEPGKFRAMSAPNGWGTYDQVLPFLLRLARDCARHPDAKVEVSL